SGASLPVSCNCLGANTNWFGPSLGRSHGVRYCRPPKAVIERWRQQADEANAKSQTPSMDVDPAVKMPEAPVHAYSYFSDTRMLRRLAYCSSGPRLTTLPESGV
ncbi:unnamed protein product, partial [Effrenium voratum]